MEFILDANPLFSALIKDSFTIRIIVSEKVELFAPEFLFDEFLEHEEEILAKTQRTRKELNQLVGSLKEIIHIIPRKEFELYLEEAKSLISDEDDVPYLALALKLNIPIWSNDKKLNKQNKVKVYSTKEIKHMLEKQDIL